MGENMQEFQEKIPLLSLSEEELRELCVSLSQKPYRAKQIRDFLLKGLEIDEMQGLPKAFREELKKEHTGLGLEIKTRLVSKIDETQKFLFGLSDGNCVEGVLMHYKYGATLCLSTQVGCKMGCKFCASTLGGLVRNLKSHELLGQFLLINRENKVGNIVLMGIGEPLDNYDEVIGFLRALNAKDGINMSLRNVSLSTCGLVGKVERLANEKMPLTLALSLHAPNDDIRRTIMPIAQKYTVAETMQAIRRWVEKTGRRIIIEYALIGGGNSSRENARELARLLRQLQCHVNLIPLNPVKERKLEGVSRKTAEDFLKELENNGISASIRREMGRDINGACGQLRRQEIQKEEIK